MCKPAHTAINNQLDTLQMSCCMRLREPHACYFMTSMPPVMLVLGCHCPGFMGDHIQTAVSQCLQLGALACQDVILCKMSAVAQAMSASLLGMERGF